MSPIPIHIVHFDDEASSLLLVCLSACLSRLLMFISYHIDVIIITINYNHMLDSLI